MLIFIPGSPKLLNFRSECSNLGRARAQEGTLVHSSDCLLSVNPFSKQLEPLEGLLPTLLQLISPSSSFSEVVRLAAAIYFKNRITSSWKNPLNPSSNASPAAIATAQKSSTFVAIPASDRQSVKSNLLPLYATLASDPSSAKAKEQVGEALRKVVECDFPKDWPGLVDEIKVMLNGNEGQVEAGLRASMAVFGSMRFVQFQNRILL